MQIGEKKSQLSDDSALYSHSTDNLTDKEKFKSLKGKKKFEFFRDYYLVKIIAIVCIVAFGASLLYTILKPKSETVFYAAIGDDSMPFAKIEEIQSAFNEIIGVDPETQETCFDTTFYFKSDYYNAVQKFGIYVAVSQIDVCIIPESVFETMAVNSYFKPISEALDTDTYLLVADKLVMSGTNDDDGNLIPDSESAYGIRLNDTKYYEGFDYDEDVVLCILANTTNSAKCVEFVKMLVE